MVRIDNPGLSMRRIRQRLAEQAFGRSGIAQSREHEVDRGAGGIDRWRGTRQRTSASLSAMPIKVSANAFRCLIVLALPPPRPRLLPLIQDSRPAPRSACHPLAVIPSDPAQHSGQPSASPTSPRCVPADRCYARATTDSAGQVTLNCCCGLKSSPWSAISAAMISFSVRCWLGTSAKTSRPRAISVP